MPSPLILLFDLSDLPFFPFSNPLLSPMGVDASVGKEVVTWTEFSVGIDLPPVTSYSVMEADTFSAKSVKRSIRV